MRAAFLIIAGLAGLALAVWLFASYDFAEVMHAFGLVGWAVVLICLWHFVPLGLDAAGWRHVLAPQRRPPFLACWPIRWISESVNTMLPVAQIGGEVVRARLVSRRSLVPRPDVSAGEAGASVVLDVTLGVAATAAFALLGLALLVAVSAGRTLDDALWGVGGLFLLLGLLVMAQRQQWTGEAARWLAGRISGDMAAAIGGGMRDFGRTLDGAWRHPGRLLRALGWRLAGSLATAGEIWLILWFQGIEVSLADAIILESLTFAVRTAAFVVPGGLGVQEATLVLLGQMLGLPPEVALSIALIKRVRELALGLPGLLAWWWLEGRVIRT